MITPGVAPSPPAAVSARLHNHLLILLLSCAFGAVFLARNALGPLAPFLAADLALQNQHIGWLAAAFSLSWAISGFVITAAVSTVAPRALLVGLLCVLAIAAAASSMANAFAALFAARMLGGVCSGPVLPLVQSFVASLGSRARGLRMGIVQGLGSSLFGAVLAPLVLVPVAVHWGWRRALLLVAVTALVCAASLARTLPGGSRHHSTEPITEPIEATTAVSAAAVCSETPTGAFASFNIFLCSLIGAAMVGWLIVGMTFYPLYLIEALGRSTAEMSAVMSLLGGGSLVAAFLVPHLSDRFGRRRIMSAFALVGALAPLGMLFFGHALSIMAVCMVAGSFAGGTFPLFMAAIPSESVSARRLAPSIGVVQGVGEIAGGVGAPVLAGWAADRYGLGAPLGMALGAALLASLVALALKAPSPGDSMTAE